MQRALALIKAWKGHLPYPNTLTTADRFGGRNGEITCFCLQVSSGGTLRCRNGW
jgi:hypothetical protein